MWCLVLHFFEVFFFGASVESIQTFIFAGRLGIWAAEQVSGQRQNRISVILSLWV